MTREGHIARWDAERGFGFIATPEGARNIFFHVRDFRGGQPAEGMAVRFEQIEVGGKGPRAMAIAPLAASGAGAPASAPGRTRQPPAQRADRSTARTVARQGNGNADPSPRRAVARPGVASPRGQAPARPAAGGGPSPWFLAAVLLWALLLATGTLRGLWPAWALALLLALNGLTYASYAIDKRAAQQGSWRTRESTLHLLALAGGWPAARWAQQRLRHKSIKADFQWAYTLTVVFNLLALAALLWRGAPLAA